MIEIEDHRKLSSWVPAVEIIEKAIPHISKKNSPGIRKIVLMDNDYHGKRDAGARYVTIKGTKKADIEIYLKHYDDMPEKMKSSKILIGTSLLATLFHELYHHIVRFHRTKERPNLKMEQRRADNWGIRRAREIIKQIFTSDELQEAHILYNEIGKEMMKSNKSL